MNIRSFFSRLRDRISLPWPASNVNDPLKKYRNNHFLRCSASRHNPRRNEWRHPCILIVLLCWCVCEGEEMDGPEEAEEDGESMDERSQDIREWLG